ncbi:MAG: MSCRAMM family protein, partial [Clostridium sp.]|uniref:MSCRAMM family protein n=1 Tax=Clostridium sp. TaxID=1506 RepID=UPI003F408DA7
MKLKRKISILASLFFITTIFYNFIPTYATDINTKSPFTTSISINGKELSDISQANPIELENGKTVSIKIHYVRQSEVKPGDKITITVPDILKNLVAGQCDLSKFEKPIVEGNTITYTVKESGIYLVGGYIGAQATLNCSDKDQDVNIPITVNGKTTIVHAYVWNPGSGSGDGSGTGGGAVTHISKTVDGKTSVQVENLTSENNSFNFQVKLDTHGLQKPSTFSDKMTDGFNYTKNSLQVLELINGQEVDVTKSLESETTTTDTSIKISNLPINEKYIINYKGIIPLDYAKGKENWISRNEANLDNYNAMAYVTFNTKANEITPDTLKDMVQKAIAPGEENNYTKVGQVKTYYLNLNQHHVLIKKGSYLVDKMPEGLSLDNTYSNAAAYNQAQQYGNYQFNILSINKDGTQKYISYDKSNEGTVILDGQTNELRVQFNEDTTDSIVVYYKATVDKLLNKITNVATLHFDGYTASGQDTLSFSYDSGDIQAHKTSNTKAIFSNGTQEVQEADGKTEIVHLKNNQNVTYDINVSANGAFPAGYLNLTDTLNKNIKLNKLPNGNYDIVTPPGYKVTVDGQTIKIVNSESIISQGDKEYSAVIKINCSLKDVPEGTTVPNSLYENGVFLNTVNVKKGYSFKAIKAALSSENSTTKNTLSGAEYGVYNEANNSLVEKVTSDKEGLIQGNINEAGNYYLKEIQAPSGYSLSDKKTPFTISKDDIGTTVNLGYIYDKKAPLVGSLQVTKTSENGTPLQGAVFTVSGAGFSKDITTGKDGIATLANIPWGTYTIKETKAPVGYNLNPDSQTVKITAENAGKVQALTFKDSQTMGIVKISKVDVTNEKEVPGAKIEITGTSLTGEKITKSFVSKDTATEFTLPAGTYTYTEISPPTGYEINKTVGTFTISKQGEVVKAEVKDQRILGSLQITKLGKDNAKLKNAEFEVTGPNKFKKEIWTDENGVTSLKDLAWGDYKIKEIVPPTGYTLSNEVQTINIGDKNASKMQEV